MEYRRLGSTGLSVSTLCFGTSRFARDVNGTSQTTHDEAIELLDACWDRGINFFDTSNSYGDPNGTSEQWIGEWLADHDREDVVIASKVYNSAVSRVTRNLSRKNIRAEIEGTLDRLGTDYIDLYYIHAWDDETPIRETLRTLDMLVQEGRVHYIGASNLAAWQLMKALWVSDREQLERFDVVQPRFNAAFRERPAELLAVADDQDIAVCPYAGLAGGFLTGKYERDAPPPSGSRGDVYDWEDRFEDRQWRVLDMIRTIAEDQDASVAQLALKWLMDREEFTCVPIVAARSVEQLDENVNAVTVSLDSADREAITNAYVDNK